jgi:hypothetical protein
VFYKPSDIGYHKDYMRYQLADDLAHLVIPNPSETSSSTPADSHLMNSELTSNVGQLFTVPLPGLIDCANIKDSESDNSEDEYADMPPLVEVSSSESDSDSDMDIESDSSASAGIEDRVIYPLSRNGELEVLSSTDDSATDADQTDSQCELEREGPESNSIPDNLEPEYMDDSDDESVVYAILEDEYSNTYHVISVFLEIDSPIIDVSECKFKCGRNSHLRNSFSMSVLSRAPSDLLLDYQRKPVESREDVTMTEIPREDNPSIRAHTLRQ